MATRVEKRRRIPRAERSDQLLDIALEIVVARGFGALTMESVARAAGVSKPIVYRSYANRAGLIVALLRREQQHIEQTLDAAVPEDLAGRPPGEVLAEIVTTLVRAAAERPLTWSLVLLPPDGTPAAVRELAVWRREQFMRRARRLVRAGLDYLPADAALDVEITARMVIAAIEEHARMVIADPAIDPEALARGTAGILAGVPWLEAPRA
jgi:AcrR family transcriptional regulator